VDEKTDGRKMILPKVHFFIPRLCLAAHVYPHVKFASFRVCFGWKSSTFNLSIFLADPSFHVSR